MLVVKARFSKDRYEAVFKGLWVAMWEQGHDLSKPPIMKEVLMRHFSADETDGILESASDPAVKKQLNEETQAVVDRGAFGCPWFFVTDAEGKTEPFFGSDRYVLFTARNGAMLIAVVVSVSCGNIWGWTGRML